MAHIHTKPGQHDHTVSAFIVRLDKDEPRVLLHRHKLLHKFLQIGGHIELDETPWQALIHEIREESGYDIGQLSLLQPKSRMRRLSSSVLHPYPVSHNTHKFDANHFHTDVEYGLIAKEAPKHKLEDDESRTLRFLSRDELLALEPEEIFENVREVYLFILDECLKKWDQVSTAGWGD